MLLIGFSCLLLGIIGSLLPVLPGPPLSWLGILFLYLTKTIGTNWWVLIVTLVIAIIITVLDYTIPAYGTKRFGGSKWGVIGTSIGLLVGLLSPIPFGFIIGPFAGAFIGEMLNKSHPSKAAKAAFGSFLGFLASTFIKFVLSIVYLGIFIKILWDYKEPLFTF
ncbi:membrane protein [Neptunitalea chrysea]|uniref:Membrane protein n=2 Tax=Neptunitalea chrysea TaxID=1647581 RepID=A0A9W6EVH2_9FLAO|nr:membrane protein [Neptunitalea chrysea]